jgi:Spy/CpxP family protein refolding chaperone
MVATFWSAPCFTSRVEEETKVSRKRKAMKIQTGMRAIALMAGALFFGAVPPAVLAQAQQDNGQQQAAPAPQQQAPDNAPADARGMRGHGMMKSLNLSDDQKAQMKKIHEDARSQVEAVRADSSLSEADRQAKIHAIHRSTMRQVRGVLTPEQRQQLREQMRERRQQRQQQQQPS